VPRSIYNGAISFAGVDVPIKVFAATEPRGLQLRELHATDGAEIAHQLVDADGKEVDREDVVKGFEVGDGEYVVLSDDELKAAAPARRKTIDVERFVPREQIDPDVYDRAYYLGPQDGGEEAYAVLAAALRKTGRVGVGRVVLRSREHLVAVLEADRMLRMHTMRFADELIDPGDLDRPRRGKRPDDRMLKMARSLVDGLSGPFRPGDFKDTYRERVEELAARKAAGEEIDLEAVREEPEASDDLTAALEASLKAAKG
jgi:DNA end-binding protein Ku